MLSRRFLALTAVTAIGVSGLVAVTAGPAVAAPGSITLTGHGYGHGRGLGQWGSYGYAVNSGWSWQQITDHYYGGTRAGSVGSPAVTVRLTALDGASTVAVWSASAFFVGYGAQAFRVAAGNTVWMNRSGGAFTATVSAGRCTGPQVQGLTALPARSDVIPSAPVPSSAADLLTVCNTGIGYRGAFHLLQDAGSTRLVNELDADSYLRGVVPRESPASWADAGGGKGAQALAAQAVAARSYGLSENRYSYAKTCDTTSCQVYGGAARNGSWIEDARSDRAVYGTSGAVRLTASGAIARTEFSSSTGGYTAGGAFPAVPDDGDSASPYHDWSTTVSASSIQNAYPSIGTFTGIRVLARNGLGADGGRVTSVAVDGTARSVTTTGAGLQNALGLRSDWFSVPSATPPLQTLMWYLKDNAAPGATQGEFPYGFPGGTRLACDVDDDGRSDVVLVSGNVWFVKTAFGAGVADLIFAFGDTGDTPVCGDWTGSGRTGIGVYRAGTFYLRDTPSTGPADHVVGFGNTGDKPVVANWAAGRATELGVFRPSTGGWFAASRPLSNTVDIAFTYGFGTGTPLPADYNGSGRAQPGMFGGGLWFIRYSTTTGPADTAFGYGDTTDTPVVGDWNGDGRADIGVTRELS